MFCDCHFVTFFIVISETNIGDMCPVFQIMTIKYLVFLKSGNENMIVASKRLPRPLINFQHSRRSPAQK